MPPLTFTVNGRSVSQEVPPATLLVDLLRGPLALTGTHVGCDTAQCGACTVLLDGDAVKSCSVLAEQVRGRSVTTIEGLASPAGEAGWAGQAGQAKGALHVVQEAFMDCHGLQCGFCTPGMVMTACCLLSKTPAPTEAQIVQALEGNLCRCTGYTNIVAAVQQAARTLNAKQGAVA
jgi:aerobic carbon-monoxide dehydrogenase small subunit